MAAISEAFFLAVAVFKARGLTPVKDRIETIELGDWRVTVNGRDTAHDSIPPFHMLVRRGDWPVLLLWPSGGMWIGDESAEDDFINALRDAGATVPDE